MGFRVAIVEFKYRLAEGGEVMGKVELEDFWFFVFLALGLVGVLDHLVNEYLCI